MALTRRNWLTIRCFWNWWSFPLFSWPSVIPDTFSLVIFDSRWHHKERLEANHSEGLQSQRSIDGTNAWVCKEQRICFEKVFYKVDIIYLFNSIFFSGSKDKRNSSSEDDIFRRVFGSQIPCASIIYTTKYLAGIWRISCWHLLFHVMYLVEGAARTLQSM